MLVYQSVISGPTISPKDGRCKVVGEETVCEENRTLFSSKKTMSWRFQLHSDVQLGEMMTKPTMGHQQDEVYAVQQAFQTLGASRTP